MLLIISAHLFGLSVLLDIELFLGLVKRLLLLNLSLKELL